MMLASGLVLLIIAGLAQSGHVKEPQEGDPCKTNIRCAKIDYDDGERNVCTSCSGPNVCTFIRNTTQYYESGIYQNKCQVLYQWRVCSLVCISTDVCNETVSTESVEYECCPGFEVAHPTNTHHLLMYHYLSGWYLKHYGCLLELNESVGFCLQDLGLSEMVKLFRKVGLFESFSSNNSSEKFTVFAPMNEAIVKSSLSKMSDSELHTALSAHVLNKKLKSKNFIVSRISETLAKGHYLHIDNTWSWMTQKNTYINGQQLIEPDSCQAINGIVHVIRNVINSTNSSIATLLQNTPSYSVISTLLESAELKHDLDHSAQDLLMTFFAPTDAAFVKGSLELSVDLVSCLSDPKNNATLETFLKYHIVHDPYYTSVLSFHSSLTTEACGIAPTTTIVLSEYIQTLNCHLVVMFTDSGISVGMTGSIITDPDIPASNGVIHAISLPLVPPSVDLKTLCADYKMAQ